MGLEGYISIKGQKQGQVKGSGPGNAGKSKIFGAKFGEFISRGPINSLLSPHRPHQPIVVRMQADTVTHGLLQAMNSHDRLDFTIEIFKKGTGSHHPNCILRVTDSEIRSIRRVPAVFKGNTHSSSPQTSEQEDIAFTFQKIDYVWNDGSVSAQDD